MKQTGIIMSGSHPVDILEGRKTMTRRTWGLEKVNKDPNAWQLVAVFQDGLARFARTDGTAEVTLRCPYGGYGDRLWVKETYYIDESAELKEDSIFYRADDPDIDLGGGKWKPSIFMPRQASRILREITQLGAERLQEITNEDAKAEGVTPMTCCLPGAAHYIIPFHDLWDSLNAKRGYPWSLNIWVWCISFRRLTDEMSCRTPMQ